MAKSLTLGELNAIEEESGRPYSQLGNPDVPQGRLVAAMVMVIKKRTDPSFNMARAFEIESDELETIMAEFQGPKAESEKTA